MITKSYRKRLKITKQGKILRRVAHQGHNQAKESPKIKRQRRKTVPFDFAINKLKKHIF